jgi:hypothetical protein
MENIMAVNLIMIDHALTDHRSVPAMLRGAGDGREQSWEDFKNAHPSLTQEELMEEFRQEARYGHIHIKNKYAIFLYKKYIAALIALIVIVA